MKLKKNKATAPKRKKVKIRRVKFGDRAKVQTGKKWGGTGGGWV